jgi:hypothetical protein
MPGLKYCAFIGRERHREAVSAAVAIQSKISDLTLDCFALLAMTPILFHSLQL